MSKETKFIKLFVAAERKFLSYLVTLQPSIQDAEELMQETSIVIWEKFDEFLATQGEEPDPDRFVAWGCKVAFYKTLNSRRKKSSTPKPLGGDVVNLISNTWLELEESNELSDRRTALASCVEKLPSDRRDLLHDYYWHRRPIEQIAKKQERTTASIYKLLQRVRMSLHKCIDHELAS